MFNLGKIFNLISKKFALLDTLLKSKKYCINLRRPFEVEGFSSGGTKTLQLDPPPPMVPPSLQWCDIKRNVLADQLARPQILLHENPLQQQEIFRRIFSSRLQIKIPSPPCLDCQCKLYVPTCTNNGFKLFLKERRVNLWFGQNMQGSPMLPKNRCFKWVEKIL